MTAKLFNFDKLYIWNKYSWWVDPDYQFSIPPILGKRIDRKMSISLLDLESDRLGLK